MRCLQGQQVGSEFFGRGHIVGGEESDRGDSNEDESDKTSLCDEGF